jgi:hypothetical protein
MGRSDTENAELHNAELAAPVQTPGNSTPESDEDLVNVLVATRDALEAGQTMRSLARNRRTPHGVREVLDRVGTQLASAGLAQLQLVAKRAKRAGAR